MTGWQGSTRRQRLPKDWPRRRAKVRRRADGRCEKVTDGRRCRDAGTECDHVTPGDNHDLTNLQWLCADHHREKTIAERPRLAPKKRPTETHPGIV